MSEERKWRKKPVVIEAFQMTDDRIADNRDWPEWANAAWQNGAQEGGIWPSRDSHNRQLVIGTLEGVHAITPGDWIIQGVAGEIYPCKPDIFAATYEPA